VVPEKNYQKTVASGHLEWPDAGAVKKYVRAWSSVRPALRCICDCGLVTMMRFEAGRVDALPDRVGALFKWRRLR